MPDANVITISVLLKYIWLPMLGAGGYLWKSLTKQINDNSKALTAHIIKDSQKLDNFVSRSYMQDDIKPWMGRIDTKMNQLVEQTADVIKREEYKSDITALNNKIDAVKDLVRK